MPRAWNKEAIVQVMPLQTYTCSALQLQALEEPSAQGRAEGSSLLICRKVPYRLAAALRGRIRPGFITVPPVSCLAETHRATERGHMLGDNSDSPKYIH